jgi:2-oxoglutarate ferredoxin oxidoreductase subunit beta
MDTQHTTNGTATEVPLPIAQAPSYTAKDFASSADVRWCPGCGDYAILAQVQRTLPDFGRNKEEYVFISGIGCSSRFPYYMNCYGFHTIHGRAPAVASGLKVMHPELSVWIVTGDGDGLSIGGNHLMHIIRRNLDCNILLFNNRIYGLTKGQYSPTSESGKKTKSTPFGSVDHPLNPVLFALGCEGTFVARTVDRDPKHQQEMYRRAYYHKGASFVEVYQNCNIFNDGAFEHLTDKKIKADNLVVVEHGKPLVFGFNDDKGVKLDGFRPVVVSLTDGSHSVDDLVVYNETDSELAYIIARMSDNPGFPTAIGVLLAVERPTYEEMAQHQLTRAKELLGEGDLDGILNEGDTWTVE